MRSLVVTFDSTVALPLLTVYALANHSPRPLRRLMDRLPDVMRQLEEAYAAQIVIQEYETLLARTFEYDRHRDQLGKPLREALDAATAITTDAYDAARRTAKRARQVLADTMADHDVILTPSAPGAAPHGLGSTGNPMFNRLWTLRGTPCVNVPGLV